MIDENAVRVIIGDCLVRKDFVRSVSCKEDRADITREVDDMRKDIKDLYEKISSRFIGLYSLLLIMIGGLSVNLILTITK
jgi:hypothetical protein